jgi:hypothetical protein
MMRRAERNSAVESYPFGTPDRVRLGTRGKCCITTLLIPKRRLKSREGKTIRLWQMSRVESETKQQTRRLKICIKLDFFDVVKYKKY